MSGWSVCWALLLVFDGRGATLASANLVLLSANIAGGAWFMLTLEYTQRKRFPNRLFLLFLVVPALTQVIAWTNPMHGLLWGPGTVVDSSGVLHADQRLWFGVHAIYSFLLTIVSIGLLLRSFVRFEGLYRKQSAILLVGVLFPFTSSLVFTTGLVLPDYLNPTPAAFIAGAAIFGWGLYQYRLFEIVPIARLTAYDVMDEAVITVDERGAIADVNRAACDLFDLRDDTIDEPFADALEAFPAVVAAYREDTVTDTLAVEVDGGYRYLTLDRKPVTTGETRVGTVLVFKDVTELKRHENELELLKQVFGRVFRHDLSNDLNVIRARGELLASDAATAEAAHARTVVEKCDDIIETSKKARAIETIVSSDRRRHDVEVVSVVEGAAAWCRDRHPDAAIEVDAPPEAWARVDGKFELAIQGLIENGVVHNDGPDPWVRVSVTVESETVEITVADDDPGINPDEAEILETREISQLKHSSGLGLWLVHWVVRNSNGTVDFTNTETGALVELTFERCLDPGAQRRSGRSAETDADQSATSNPQP
jgi:PAS domain S-box-containing protein